MVDARPIIAFDADQAVASSSSQNESLAAFRANCLVLAIALP